MPNVMTLDNHAPRLLGAAFLLVIFTSLTGALLHSAVAGSGDVSDSLLLSSSAGAGGIGDIMARVARKPDTMRLSSVFELLNSSAIVVLASLLFLVLKRQGKVLALIALGWWLAEALILGLTSTATSALIPLSQDFVRAGSPQDSVHHALGAFLYYGVWRHGYNGIHMWFYSIGGVLWYYLFFKSRYVPRPIALWGLLAACVSVVGVVFVLWGYEVPYYVFIPLLPFELTIGTWLLLRGIENFDREPSLSTEA